MIWSKPNLQPLIIWVCLFVPWSWHRIALAITVNAVKLFVDCRLTEVVPVTRETNEILVVGDMQFLTEGYTVPILTSMIMLRLHCACREQSKTYLSSTDRMRLIGNVKSIPRTVLGLMTWWWTNRFFCSFSDSINLSCFRQMKIKIGYVSSCFFVENVDSFTFVVNVVNKTHQSVNLPDVTSYLILTLKKSYILNNRVTMLLPPRSLPIWSFLLELSKCPFQGLPGAIGDIGDTGEKGSPVIIII